MYFYSLLEPLLLHPLSSVWLPPPLGLPYWSDAHGHSESPGRGAYNVDFYLDLFSANRVQRRREMVFERGREEESGNYH